MRRNGGKRWQYPPGAPDVRPDFCCDMDQRTDTEHRLDAAPGHDIKPAIGEVPKAQPWLDRMRQRRRQILVIPALIFGLANGFL